MSRLTATLVLAAIVALGGVLVVAVAPWVDLEQELGLAWLFHARGPVAPPGEVVIVAIDEDSALQLGVSDKPREWPRTLHAELVRYLAQAGARVIAFDLTFDTPSPQPDDDAAFASAARAAGNVLVTQSVQRDTLQVDSAAGQPAGTVVIDRPAAPVPVIAQAVAGYAPFLLPKTSRVDAYWTFWSGAPDQPTLPVLALRVYASSGRPGQAPGEPGPGDRERWNTTLARLQASGDTSFLNLYGPPQTLATVPYHLVLALARGESTTGAALDAGMFRGKAVFVGLSARTPAGQDRLRDDYGTVYSQANGLNLTGVELAATAFANLLDDRPLRPAASAWHYASVLLWALGLALLWQGLPPVRAVPVTGVVMLLYLWLVVDRFANAALWLPLVVPVVVQVPLALFASISIRYRASRNEREAIKLAFGHFLPPEMVDRLAIDLGPVTRSNRVVFGSCLATDAGNYTAVAEKMDPGQLGRWMNDYFAQLFAPVERSGGAVVDVVGDAMVAIWAGSKSSQSLRQNACEAAIDIVAVGDRFSRGLSGGPWLPTRLGLHSGDMLVGNIGASHHFEYRAVGDIVNTASRLQGLNKILGTTLLASTATVDGLDGLVTRPLGSFVLPGKASALAVVELLGHRVDASPAQDRLCAQFERALASYGAGQWHEAADRFTEVLIEAPQDGPARFYLARCKELLAHPAAGPWNPTITVDSK